MWPPWVQYTTHFSHLLTVINSSVNFYIYALKHYSGHVFREILPRRWRSHPEETDLFGSQVEIFFILLGFLEMLFFQIGETVMTRHDSKKVRKQK